MIFYDATFYHTIPNYSIPCCIIVQYSMLYCTILCQSILWSSAVETTRSVAEDRRNLENVSQIDGKIDGQIVVLYYAILCYIVLYYTIPCSVMLYSIMPYYAILHYTILYYIVSYYTIICYTKLYYSIPYYTILFQIILYYTIPCCTILWSQRGRGHAQRGRRPQELGQIFLDRWIDGWMDRSMDRQLYQSVAPLDVTG